MFKKMAKLLAIAGVQLLLTSGTIDPKMGPYLDELNIAAFDSVTLYGKLKMESADLEFLVRSLNCTTGTNVSNGIN